MGGIGNVAACSFCCFPVVTILCAQPVVAPLRHSQFCSPPCATSGYWLRLFSCWPYRRQFPGLDEVFRGYGVGPPSTVISSTRGPGHEASGELRALVPSFFGLVRPEGACAIRRIESRPESASQ